MIWDDINLDQSKAFEKIWKDLQKNFHLDDNCKEVLPINGWLGVNEHVHQVGIIKNLK